MIGLTETGSQGQAIELQGFRSMPSPNSAQTRLKRRWRSQGIDDLRGRRQKVWCCEREMRFMRDKKAPGRTRTRCATLPKVGADPPKTLFWPQGIDVFARKNRLRNPRPLIGLCDVIFGLLCIDLRWI